MHLSTQHRSIDRDLDWTGGNILVWLIACLLLATFIFVGTNTPLAIMVWQSFDDALFVRIGESLAAGRWLGAFDELTLAKGPGYPAFLAVSYWSGLPITLSQAAFHSLAAAALACLAYKASSSRVWALAMFALVLLHPKLLELGRIMRDGVYMGQSLLVIALTAYTVFYAPESKKVRLSVLSGTLLAWFWLTREEGVWLVPSLLIILSTGFLDGRRKRTIPLTSAFAFVATFLTILMAFHATNYAVYGKFVGIDFKEHNFQSAITAMESVSQAQPVPFVAVPFSLRARLYDVSPAFATLKPILDPEKGKSPWTTGGCTHRPTACGDISNGYFMWAVRDAASKLGHYKSPETAAAFFAQVSREVQAACADGRLDCSRDIVPLLPPLTNEQIHLIPGSFKELLRAILSPGKYPGYGHWDVIGDDSRFARTVAFLNHPPHLSKQDVVDIKFEATGWYLNQRDGDDWFTLRVSDRRNDEVPATLERKSSPDLVQSQKNELADNQRFHIAAECIAECDLAFTDEAGAEVRIRVGAENDQLPNQYFQMDGALLAFDNLGSVQRTSSQFPDRKVRAAERIHKAEYKVFRFLMPPLVIAGFLAFVLLALHCAWKRTMSVTFVIAFACWTAVAARGTILIMVDISSFPAIHTPYLLPVYGATIAAAVFSLMAARQWLSSSRMTDQAMNDDPVTR